MRVLFLTRYDFDGASSRYRIIQYLPHLRAAGIDCEYSPFANYGYVGWRFSNSRALKYRSAMHYWRRFTVLRSANRFDVLYIEKEVFPYIPALVELSLLSRSLPYVVDYDDAVFHVYDDSPSSIVRWLDGDKIGRVMARAKGVMVGSEYLQAFAVRHNPQVYRIPTVIDLRKYPASEPPTCWDEPFTIGWIGSQSTVVYLKAIEHVLDQFCRTHSARVVVIGGSRIPLDIQALQWIPWSADREVEHLSKIDVGIMPLPDIPWTRGKCAFKLIQYMGCWKPVIASPVGENLRVIEDGKNGFLAATPEDWLKSLERLYQDRRLGQSMGKAGRAKVEADYSLDIAVPQLIDVLRSVVS